ncbi:MAG: prenyltransferase [Pseudomonadota bacterium]|nr:prenyltransferase [Pseudomonadota bacterium]
MKMHLKTIIGTMRPNFLLLSMVVVLLGTALALYDGAEWSISLFALLMVGGVLAHACVNMQNEYEDFKSGLDDLTERTPFSGGSGSLQANPEAASYVLKVLFGLFAVLIGIGLYLVSLKGWGLLPIGLAGVAVIVTYTSKITHQPWMCLFAPGLAFGPLMVLGSYYVWTGTFSWGALWVSLVPFFLVNNLLLLNQFPDLEADRKVGRYNILMLLGERRGSQLFNGFLLLSFVMILMAVWSAELPTSLLVGFVTLLLAIPLFNVVSEHYHNIEKLMPALAMNVIINLLTPLLMAGGLLWAIE